MKATLQLKQAPHLQMTPQLQQAIRLLQLSTLEIAEETSRLLETNPFLERSDDTSASDDVDPAAASASAAPVPADGADPFDSGWSDSSYAVHGAADEDDEESCFDTPAAHPSLREHLLSQLGTSQLDARDAQLVGLLIDALDENGYLAQPLDDIAAMLPPELGITLDDLETALVQLQHLDEPGIGARTLAECLALQLEALPPSTPARTLALSIVRQHLDLLAARDFARLKKVLYCDDGALRAAQQLILRLHPKPGLVYEDRAADYVVPDVLVEKIGGIWQARLNPDALPRLRINQMYAAILQQRGDAHTHSLTTQLQEARWFIKNLQQRFDTILRVAQAIVERQRLFFQHGEIAMRPLVLREIAEQLDLHESTISRVTTQKYMHTPRGIYEFKYFFGSGVSTESGGTCSSTAIRALIKQMVEGEDKKNPLSDSRMAEILVQQGIMVARRTVAKYREGMNIPPVHLRKSI